jgi:hypothetical protein
MDPSLQETINQKNWKNNQHNNKTFRSKIKQNNSNPDRGKNERATGNQQSPHRPSEDKSTNTIRVIARQQQQQDPGKPTGQKTPKTTPPDQQNLLTVETITWVQNPFIEEARRNF